MLLRFGVQAGKAQVDAKLADPAAGIFGRGQSFPKGPGLACAAGQPERAHQFQRRHVLQIIWLGHDGWWLSERSGEGWICYFLTASKNAKKRNFKVDAVART
ncbi:hypothetical protein BTHE68_34110 [Burkholderia sp. THE68]|nr:hypothetical protein BTHE68_34110 [Burkholderia sp. THE68]